LGDTSGDAPSRQAVCKRVNGKFVKFLQLALEQILSAKFSKDFSQAETTCFKRIIVQDSTVIKLPSRLFEEFSGVSNAHCAVCNARIQGVYDLLDKRFLYFSIDKYSKNDMAAAPELDVQEGDLVLRDRGYLTHAEVKRNQESGAYHIHRHSIHITYRDPVTDELIDLAGLLKTHGRLDMIVCLNDDDRTQVRLIAAAVDEETANLRRMKAKKDCRGHKPSENLLFLMSWTIFITNLPSRKFDFSNLLTLYRLRWRIENIFKTWKSNMAFASIHNVSSHQLRALLMARLITITVTMHYVYNPCATIIAANSDRYLSMMKLMRYIQVRKERLPEIIQGLTKNIKQTAFTLIKFCAYDKRKRLNYVQKEKFAINNLPLS